MNKFLFLYFIIFSSIAYSSDTTYIVVEIDGKKGLKDSKGNFVIPALYDDIGWSDGSHVPQNKWIGYKMNEKWGLIHITTHKKIEANYYSLIRAKAEYFIASVKGKFSRTPFYGVIDTKGKINVSFNYYALQPINNCLLVLNRKNNKYNYGLINYSNQVLLEFKYEKIVSISNQLVKAKDADKKDWVVYHTSRRTKISDNYQEIGNMIAGHFIVRDKSLLGIMDSTGVVKIQPKYEKISMQNGVWKGKLPTVWKIIEENNQVKGKIVAMELSFIKEWIKTKTLEREQLHDQQINHLLQKNIKKIQNIIGNKLLYKENGKFKVYDIGKQKDMKLTRFDSAFMSGEFIHGANRNSNQLQWAIYDTFGVKRTRFDYELIEPYAQRLFKVKRRQHWGYINRQGKEQIHCVYDDITEYKHGIIVVKYHNQYGIIDKYNNWVVFPQVGKIRLVNDNLYLSKKGGTTQLFNMQGDLIYFTDYPLEIANETLVELLPSGRKRLVSFDGVFVKSDDNQLRFGYEAMKYLNDNMIAVKWKGKYGFVNKNNQWRITNRYEDVGRYSEEGIAIKIRGKWGLIDTDENILVQPLYDTISYLSSGIATVLTNGKYGLVNNKGKVILPIEYSNISTLPTGEYLVKKSNKYGLVDKYGRQIINTKYDKIDKVSERELIIKKRNKYGTVNRQGVNVIPAQYDKLIYHSHWSMFFGKLIGKWENLGYLN